MIANFFREKFRKSAYWLDLSITIKINWNKEIETLIYKLPQPYQIVIYFKYISSFSFYEIAGNLEYSSKRIYQLHSEGLEKLLEIMKQNDKS